MRRRLPLFRCQECGRGFPNAVAANHALCHGCPGCGGTDIDLAGPEAFAEAGNRRIAAGRAAARKEAGWTHGS